MSPRIARTRLVDLATLKTFPANPRRGDVQAIKASLQRSGQYRAIVVRESTSEVLAGNHTMLAMRELGWQRALCHLLDVDDEQARAIVLADNRTAELAGYDEQALADLLSECEDLAGTGWDQGAVDELSASLAPDRSGQDTEPGEVPAEPRTKPGDLWLLGEHRLLCGDATVAGDVAKLMGGGVAEMVMADPPYNVKYRGGTNSSVPGHIKRNRADAYDDDRTDYGAWLAQILTVAHSASDKSAALHLWHASCELRAVLAAVDAARWADRSLLVWNKGNIMGGLGQAAKQYHTQFEPMLYCHKRGQRPRWYGPGNESDVWAETGSRSNPLHPTMKPIPLYERSLTNHTQAGDTVLELFGGSGTTLIAAQNLGRRARLTEIDPGYCDVIVDRFERHSGLQARLDG